MVKWLNERMKKMRNFLIAAVADIVLILVSYFIFRAIISGPTRHRLYEKFLSSFAKFVILIFLASLIITGITALALYRTRYIQYINIVAPALVSILVGFIVSTVPTRGYGDKEKGK
jgi:succinate dehydrogenase hydrophobic anchor subunit